MGQQKRSSMRQNKANLLEQPPQDAEKLSSTIVKSAVAASTSKLGLFGISLQQLETNTINKEEANDNCYVSVQRTSICKC